MSDQAAQVPPSRRRRVPRPLLKLLIVLFGLGMVILLVAGIAILGSQHSLSKHGVKVTGTVVDVAVDYNTNDQLFVDFTTADGRQMKGVEIDSDHHSHHQGDTITVEYLPDDPNVARVAGSHNSQLTGCGMAGIGLLGTVGAVALLLPSRRSVRRPRPGPAGPR